MDYQGWTLFDKVLIVAKKLGHWDSQESKYVEDDDRQGYIVDPANKKMKETAQRWAETCRAKYDETGQYKGYDREPGEEFLYDNDGFRLELLETAGGSSQGGKLSFWNCWVTAPDGKRFKVGIAADLLLELLLQTVFDRGACTSPLCFARCKGGVGMLHKDSVSYQQALSDMQKKADVKTKKTSKHKIGYAYSALQEVGGYIADLYVWYDPIKITRKSGCGIEYAYTIGYKKRETPKKLYWFDSLLNYEPGKIYKTSSVKSTSPEQSGRLTLWYWSLRTKLPARMEVGPCIEYDLPVEECIQEYNKEYLYRPIEKWKQKNHHPDNFFYFSDCEFVGLSTNPDSYEMPTELRETLRSANIRIED